MIGRVLSLVLFANLGLVPVSQAVPSALLKVSINGMFITAGLLLMLIATEMLLTPDLKIIGVRMAGTEVN